ncbi:Phage-related minor tail protein [Neomoorella glycerini]|uniref:Phage-related minor tail protein n=1 Tax=Neomoorella glycerini TaxID=55779 RepID=A0A6I5ZQA6_9FIRM|nr:phage tail tape measure protein [Moorella glycerini]QGP91711.1 Phage-related minor tail protein [Moorella glycerini]
MGLETIYRLSVILKLSDLLSGPMRGAQVAVNKTNERLQALANTSKNLMAAGGAMTAAGTAILGAVLLPTKATFETQRALGELASVGVTDLQALEKAAMSFSNKWAGTTKAQFISAAYDIKGGISSLTDTGVAEYTRLAALTAKATKATTEEMTSLFATGYGIYKDMYNKLSDEAFGQMFSGGIAAAVNQFKSTGPQMAQALTTLGAAATSAKRPMEEQLTVLGMLQATMPGGEAGTKYRAFIQSAAKAGKELGLSFVDSKNQLLGVTEIIAKLRAKYGDTLDAIEKQQIAKAFGTDEAVAMIDLLYPKLDSLKDNIGNIREAMKGGTKVTLEMARAMNIDPGSRWQILGQQWQNLKEVVGGELLPTFNQIMDKTGGFLQRLTDLAQANPGVARSIGLVAAGAGVLLAALGGASLLIGGVGYMFTQLVKPLRLIREAAGPIQDAFLTLRIRGMYAADSLRKGFSTIRAGAASAGRGVAQLAISTAQLARRAAIAAAGGLRNMAVGLVQLARRGIMAAATALPGLIASVWSFTAALLANPITWVVMGVIALVAALVLLWRNWDAVTAAFARGWEWIKNVFTMGKQWLAEALTGMKNLIVGKFTEFKESGAALLQAFVDGLKSMVMQPYEVVKGGLAKLRRLLPFSDAKEGPLSQLTKSGGALITTLAGGIYAKQHVLYAAMSDVLGGAGLTPALAAGGEGFAAPPPGLAKTTSVNIREIFRERSITRERERSVETRRGGPLVALHYYGNDRAEARDLLRDLEAWLSRNQ